LRRNHALSSSRIILDTGDLWYNLSEACSPLIPFEGEVKSKNGDQEGIQEGINNLQVQELLLNSGSVWNVSGGLVETPLVFLRG
jgi:hypothetical protein